MGEETREGTGPVHRAHTGDLALSLRAWKGPEGCNIRHTTCSELRVGITLVQVWTEIEGLNRNRETR